MKYGSVSLLLICLVAFQQGALHGAAAQSAGTQEQKIVLAGRWRVKFTMAGLEKNLILVSRAGGIASFVLQDTAPDDKPVGGSQPAAWSQLTGNRVSFSGEVELPIGTCCREMGTLIFKGRFSSNNSMSGKLVFVTSVDEEESPYKFRTVIGNFTATRVLK